MSAISAISSVASQPTMALLQLQMIQYAFVANSPNWQGKADYETLQNAIDTGNVSAALVALGRLQREAKIPPPPDASIAPQAAAALPQQTISDISSASGSGAQQSTSGASLNATA